MKLKRSGRGMVTLGVVVCMLLSFLFVGLQPAFGQGTAAANTEEPPMPPEEPRIPGTLEGTGTYFELTDSEYLNITVESTEPVHLMLESVPEMIVMHLEAAGEASSTVMSLGGFPASTTYYKYEDDYHNEVSFTTDDNGGYTFTQDMSEPHLIFIQSRAGTKFIPSDTLIGTWDPISRTYTLTTDVSETIQVDEDNLTLDGNGFTITGRGSGIGVALYSRRGVSIKNLTVEKFAQGIRLDHANNNTLTANTAISNGRSGIGLFRSNNNTLTDNVVTHSSYGLELSYSSGNNLVANTADSTMIGIGVGYWSNNNTLTGNTASNNRYGIELLFWSGNNTLTGNAAASNLYFGIRLNRCSNNTVTDNVVTSNNTYGLAMEYSDYNTLSGNTASENHYGILIGSSTGNQVYNNNFIDNSIQAHVLYAMDNVFSLDKPVGGNYWSDWTAPDADGDGFVDSPYVFTGGQDDLPWTRQDGWKTIPVEIDIKPGSYPNCFNVNGHGVIPVAILGSAEFDVTQIDISTVSFAGLEVSVKGNDNPQCSVADVSGDFTCPEGAPDGWADLVCQFVDDPTSWCPGDSTATLDGSLLDGRSFEGTDEICIVP